MRILHYSDSKGGGIVIASAPDSHVAQYSKFLQEELGLEFTKLPKRSDKVLGVKVKKKNKEWLLPPARGTHKTLVPAPGSCPCNICEFAQYNQLCQHQSICATFVYWTMNTAKGFQSNGLPDLKRALISQFGKDKNESH